MNVITNNIVHGHNTRSNFNIGQHIHNLSSVDKHSFVYNAMLHWNACHINDQALPGVRCILSLKNYIV